MRHNYQDAITGGKNRYGDKFSDTHLAPQFIRYYESQQRIEVTTTYENGETWIRRGTVGMTTGWVPCFILMGRVSDSGSSDVLKATDKVTAVIGSHSARYPVAA
jgi:hypothetical protein